jgi:hypothetical protein
MLEFLLAAGLLAYAASAFVGPWLKGRERLLAGPPGELEGLELFARSRHGAIESPRGALGEKVLDGTKLLLKQGDRRAWVEVDGDGPWTVTAQVEIDPDLDLEIRRPSVYFKAKKKNSARFSTPAPEVPRADLPEDPRFEVRRASDERGEIELFVHGGEKLTDALARLLYGVGVESVRAERGLLIGDFVVQSLIADRAGDAVALLDEIARAYVRKKAGPSIGSMTERFLWLEGGAPRCPYCHVDIAEGEAGILACGKCRTIHHEGCWKEHGRCTLLGCGGTAPA